MSDAAFPKITVSNNSNQKLEIFDVFNNSDSGTGPLTYTLLATLEKGASQTVQMQRRIAQIQAMYSGSVPELDNETYHRFPVAVRSVNRNNASQGFTISADDFTAAAETEKFIEFVYSNPNAKTAKNFNAALTATTNQESTVDAFFASTASFSKCTMKTWSAVSSWQEQFFSAWQGTYYIYSNPDDPSKTPITAVAQLTISGSADSDSGTLVMTDDDGNTSANSQHVALAMAGDGTMADAAQGAGPVAVSLQPTWMNTVKKDKSGKSTYLISSALAGTIGSTKVVGTRQKQDLPNNDGSGFDAKLFDDVWSKLTGSVGLLVSFGMLYMMYKQTYRDHVQKKDDIEDRRGDESDSEVDEEFSEEDERYGNEISDNNSKTESTRSSAAEEESDEEELRDNRRKRDIGEELEEEDDDLSTATDDEAPNKKVEDAESDIEKEEDDLSDQDVTTAKNRMDAIHSEVDDSLKDSRGRLNANEADAMKEVDAELEEEKKEEDDEEEEKKEHDEEDEDDESEPAEEGRDTPSEVPGGD